VLKLKTEAVVQSSEENAGTKLPHCRQEALMWLARLHLAPNCREWC